MEKQQVVVIGGGETFDTHKDYLKFLREDMKYDPYKVRKTGWKENLQKDLGHRFEVLSPSMPNKLNAKYQEWLIYFEKVVPYLIGNEPVFVGHSLGGLFLLKYLSDHYFNTTGVMLVSSPSDVRDKEGYADFSSGNHWGSLKNLHIFHSHDDKIVTPHHAYMTNQMIGGELHWLEGRGHFIHDSHFPELVAAIREVSRSHS